MRLQRSPHRSDLEWAPFSEKQRKILTWWMSSSPVKDRDGIIADGAIRSGKTFPMGISFVNWAMTNFRGCNFAICGKTIGSLRRNVIATLKQQMDSLGYRYEDRRTDNLIVVRQGETVNYFYLFGGKDESSQDLIQGITLAGIFYDEVALMPESFVNQGDGRCSVNGAKTWYNCNPQGPSHWFKQKRIDTADENRLLYLHFTMDDNLTLSEETRERYRRKFSGVFFQRNIQGLWVAAEGKIYLSFDDSRIIPAEEWNARGSGGFTHSLRRCLSIVTMGVDFGGNRSSHAFVLTGFTRDFKHMVTLKELRIRDAVDPQELNRRFLAFVKECREEYPALSTVYCDSAEQVLIRGLRKTVRDAAVPVAVKNAKKGEIIDRIRFYCAMQAQGRHWVVSDCPEVIRAFDEAVWAPDKDDVRLDDNSTNIDSLDAQEYSSEAYMKIMMEM